MNNGVEQQLQRQWSRQHPNHQHQCHPSALRSSIRFSASLLAGGVKGEGLREAPR